MKRQLVILLCMVPVALLAQPVGRLGAATSSVEGQAPAGGLDPATLLKPLGASWPTYSGDYTGRRYSSLTQINQTSGKNLGLAWLARGFTQGARPTGRGGAGGGPGGGGGGGRGGGGADIPINVAGEGTGDINAGGAANMPGSILMV